MRIRAAFLGRVEKAGPVLGFGPRAILLQPRDPDVNPHPTHDLPPLAELEHAQERALAGPPTVRAAWLLGPMMSAAASQGLGESGLAAAIESSLAVHGE